MEYNDIERLFQEAKFVHLTDEELESYNTGQLDDITSTRAEAHLKVCLICGRRFSFMQATEAAAQSEVTAEDMARLREIIRRTPSPYTVQRPTEAPAATRELASDVSTWKQRLADALEQATEAWQAMFAPKQPVWGGLPKGGDALPTSSERREIWRWQSADRLLTVHVLLATDGSLTIHFISRALQLEGKSFFVHLGSLQGEALLRRVSRTEVGARILIPKDQLPTSLSAFSLKMDEKNEG